MRNWRVNLILILICVFWATILGRLVILQILQHQFYKAHAEGQQKVLEYATGERGEIFLNNGEPLAVNKKGKYVFISPKEIKGKEETAKTLSEILGLDKDWVLEKVNKANFFEPIKHRISDDEEKLLKEKGLKGVYLEEEIYRYYPKKNLTSHITGFLGGEGKGQYGLEGYYDEILKGEELLEEKEKGTFGYFNLSKFKETGGKNIVLTIDSNIQFMAGKLLSEAQKDLGFESGQIIVVNPKTGEILALFALPNFDPNLYSKENSETFLNPSFQEFYEPGSVFKPIVMASALNEGKITPKTTYTDPGIIEIGGWPVYNYDKRVYPGKITMTEVLEKSINTGAVFAERQLGNKLFSDYIERFGFFEKTGIDLEGEIFSENKEFKKGYEINFVTAAFGQGIELTPIQLVRAFSAIANGGNLITPYIVEKTIPASELPQKKEQKQVISKDTALQTTTMLVSVIENGFSKKAKIAGYYLTGKTGTAQVSWPALGIKKSGYSSKTWQTFIGFGPAFDPKFLILVKLDDPKAKTAEYSALPIFKQLAKYIIDYWQIPPDYEE